MTLFTTIHRTFFGVNCKLRAQTRYSIQQGSCYVRMTVSQPHSINATPSVQGTLEHEVRPKPLRPRITNLVGLMFFLLDKHIKVRYIALVGYGFSLTSFHFFTLAKE